MENEKNKINAPFKHLAEECIEVSCRANELRPSMEKWGVMSYGDMAGSQGGGHGGFLWFETREELLDYVGRLLTFLCGDDEKHGMVAQEAAAIVSLVVGDEISMEEGMSRLNSALKTHSHIQWWGQFKDLISGDSQFEHKLRGEHRGKEDEPSEDRDVAPIREDELDSFIDDTVSLFGI